MLAKFKDGTPCTIRALLAFAEKHHYVNFIVLTDGMFITIKSIDRKDNGRIKHIEFDILAPSYICKAGDSYYKKATFSGKEKVANDFLDTWVFSFGTRVDEDAMTTIPSLDGAELIWSADQEKKIEAIKEELLSEHNPRLLMFSTKWILHNMNQENKLKDEFVLKEPVSEQKDCIIYPNNEDTLIWSADETGKVATGTIKKLRLREEFVLRCPLITNEKQIYASINEEPQTSSDKIILDSIPKLNRAYEPKTIMVSSACEGMYMDTD